MLGQITCDTPISSILSEDDISSVLANVETVMTDYITSVNDLVHQEENVGLSLKAFLVGDKPLLNGRANTFLSNIKLLATFASWKSELMSSLSAQRLKELQKLASEIEKEIEDLKAKFNQLSSAYQSATDHTYKTTLSYSMNACGEAINKYENKLKTVKGLM